MLTAQDKKVDEIVRKRRDRFKRKSNMINAQDKRFNAIMKIKQDRAVKPSYSFFSKTWVGGVRGNKIHISKVLKNNMWAGKRCFIIAGGPSVADFDLSILENELTIGINRVYEIFTPTILFAMDGGFHNWIMAEKYGKEAKKKFLEFNGVKAWLDISNHNINDVFYINTCGVSGISTDLNKGLYHGNNSGYGALNLAITLGVKEIYLIGYDMKFTNGKSHYHSGHPRGKLVEKDVKSFVGNFNKNADKIKAMGVRVINLNRDSGLKCFEFGDMPKIKKVKKPIFVSFYTADDIYKVHAKNLKKNLWERNLRFDIEKINPVNWADATNYKPEFVQKMMLKHKGKNIVWIDIDALVRQEPELFYNTRFDFAFHLRKKRKNRPEMEMLSGTLFFKNNARVKKLVQMWREEVRKNPDKWDQKNLKIAFDIWSAKKKENTSMEIGAEYCCIMDGWEKKNGVKPVIEHFQASRQGRHKNK